MLLNFNLRYKRKDKNFPKTPFSVEKLISADERVGLEKRRNFKLISFADSDVTRWLRWSFNFNSDFYVGNFPFAFNSPM